MNALKRSTGSRSESSIAPTAFWHDMRTTDFARVDVDRTVALLPVAAIEQHGPHLRCPPTPSSTKAS
jgi:hypothetical protein